MATVQRLSGRCHCGAVQYEAEVDLSSAFRCNCTICTKLSAVVASTRPSAFHLLSGEEWLREYRFGQKRIARFFCDRCGVHCFGRGYLEEVGGDYVSVNFNCLDDVDPNAIPILFWDGRHNNWEAGPRPTPWPIRTGGESARAG